MDFVATSPSSARASERVVNKASSTLSTDMIARRLTADLSSLATLTLRAGSVRTALGEELLVGDVNDSWGPTTAVV